MSREGTPQPRRHVTTLIYARRGRAVALIERSKAPNLGLWSPPGGKLEPGETPLACALRELAEETGLRAETATLRAVVTEWDATRDETWLMFVFLADAVAGELGGDQREGRAAWVPLADLPGLAVPPADPHILRAVMARRRGVAFVDVRMADGAVLDVTVARDR